MRRVKRLLCRIVGHRMITETFDGRGRRIQMAKCQRCNHLDLSRTVVMPLNRKVRRRWARDVARKVARA